MQLVLVGLLGIARCVKRLDSGHHLLIECGETM